MNPPIAVLMCVYNAERFLRETLDSVLAQSYENFVFIICNDGSTDGSLAILREYADRDPRIRIVDQQPNGGIVKSRNRLFAEIPENAVFAAWIDADDVMFPDRLQKQCDFLTAHPEIGGVGSSLVIIDENSEITGFRSYPESAAEVRRKMPYQDVLAQPAMMLRVSLIRRTGWYSESCPVSQDYEYWLRAMDHAEFANLHDPVLKYRISSSQCKRTKLKLTLSITMKIQRDHFRRIGRKMPFPLICRQIAGHLLLCLPSSWILKLFCFLTYRKGARR